MERSEDKLERIVRPMRYRAFAGVVALAMLGSAFAFVNLLSSADVIVEEYYVSDTNDLWWNGARSVDGSGYVVPSGPGSWSNAVLYTEPGFPATWNGMLAPADLKTKLLSEAPIANWIWKVPQVTGNEITTGDIVHFKKSIDIPDNVDQIQADLFVITADNAYYFYVNDNDWSGPPVGSASFATGYGPTSFYYVSDGVTEKSGGSPSAAKEVPGLSYPYEAAIGTYDAAQPSYYNWAYIEWYDVSTLLSKGTNTLQIVAVNEHAPPDSGNPAGLIYKLRLSYRTVQDVTIDVKPGSYPNSICLQDQGLLPVAILGEDDLDVTKIDPSTISLGGVSLATRGSVKNPKLAYSFEDVNGDGLMDLMAFFSVPSLVSDGVLQLDPLTTAVTLTADVFDGPSIVGTDTVNIVPPT